MPSGCAQAARCQDRDAEQRLAAERDRVAREAEAKAINVDADTLATAIAAFDQAGKAMVAALGPLAARLPGVDPNFVPRLSSVTGDLGTAARELVTWRALMPHGSWTPPPLS